MTLQYASDEELAAMFASGKPVVVLFSLERDADLTMSRVLGRVADERSDMLFCTVRVASDPPRANRYQVSATPLIRVFDGSRPIAQFAGPQPRDTLLHELNAIANRPARDMPTLEPAALNVRVPRGEWVLAACSGIVAGVAFGVSLRYFTTPFVFIVPLFSVGIFVLNERFQFSWPQKAFAIAVMIAVGILGDDLLRLGFAPQ